MNGDREFEKEFGVLTILKNFKKITGMKMITNENYQMSYLTTRTCWCLFVFFWRKPTPFFDFKISLFSIFMQIIFLLSARKNFKKSKNSGLIFDEFQNIQLLLKQM